MNRRWRNLVFPRKRRFDPPWAVVAATPPAFNPATIDQGGTRPPWTPLPRRGRFQAVVPSPVVATPPTFVPNFTAPALRQRSTRARRGTFPIVPASTRTTFAPIEPFIQQAGPRTRPVTARRGQFQQLSPSAAQPVSALVEPSGPRPRIAIARRGRFWSVPPAVVTAGTGPVVSPYIEPGGPRARTYTPRRGTFYRVPLVGLAPAAPTSPPGFTVSNRPTPVPVRRALTRWVPPVVLGVPDQISPTRASLRPTRRGSLVWTPPTQPATITPWVPDQVSPPRTSRIQQPRHGMVRWAPTALPAVSTSWIPDQISAVRMWPRQTRRGHLLWMPPTLGTPVQPVVPDRLNPSRSTRGILTRRGRYWVLVSQPAISAPPTFVHRIRSRRPITLPVRRGTILDNWAAIVPTPHFVSQDLTATVTITAYSAAASITALAATATADALGASVIVDA